MNSVLREIGIQHDVFTVQRGDRRLSDEIDSFKSRESLVVLSLSLYPR